MLTVFAIALVTTHTARSRPVAQLLVEGARAQLLVVTTYDPAYVKISYPNGDVPFNRGVCTDVVIRAYRHAGFDLQKLVHQDISAHWALYPRYPGNPRPDTNIDHRRVPNQAVFFRRHGVSLPISVTSPAGWLPGDIVDWQLASGRTHTGMLSDKSDAQGFPLVIHNNGEGPKEEDVLRSWPIMGHYRYPGTPSHRKRGRHPRQ